MKKRILFSLFIILPGILLSQVKITDDAIKTDPSDKAVLHVESKNNKGVMLPKVRNEAKLPYYDPKQEDNYTDDPTFAGAISYVKDRENFYYYDGEKWINYPQISEDAEKDRPIARFAMREGQEEDGVGDGQRQRGEGTSGGLWPILPADPYPTTKWLKFRATADVPEDIVYDPIIHQPDIVQPDADYTTFTIQKTGTYTISAKVYGKDFVGNSMNAVGRISICKGDENNRLVKKVYEIQKVNQGNPLWETIMGILQLTGYAFEQECVAFLRTSTTLNAGDKIRIYFDSVKKGTEDPVRWHASINMPMLGIYFNFDITAESRKSTKQVSEVIFIYHGN